MSESPEPLYNISAMSITEEDFDKAEEEYDDDQWWIADSEIINAAYYALDAVNGMDELLGSEEDKKRKKRIQRKSLRLIDFCLGQLYEGIFDEKDKD